MDGGAFCSNFNVKIVFVKGKEFTLSQADLKFKMSPRLIQQKSRRINFLVLVKLGAVSIIIAK